MCIYMHVCMYVYMYHNRVGADFALCLCMYVSLAR